jgi:hypothetical protein
MNYIFCPQCDETLPETCFFADKSRKSERRGWCKACEAEKIQEWKVRTGRIKQPRSADLGK